MAASWDRRSVRQQAATRNAALKRQVAELAAFSPYWRDTVRGTGVVASSVATAEDLVRVPAVGERDLCPDGDPTGAARLVLQPDEAGYAVSAAGPDLRQAIRRRVTSRRSYRRQVESAIRPVAYHLGGLALPLPIASTRDDLDIVARAGARAWRVLGLGADDVLVSALPAGMLADALRYAAIGAGAVAAHPGPATAGEALEALPVTVVAVGDAGALDRLGPLPATVHTVLVTGDDAGVAGFADGATVLRIWGPPDGRWFWAECRHGGRDTGLHTYPDLEILETVDAATGEPAPAGELVLTQLGVRGSALVRWRTGAVQSGLETLPCPACKRTVPRVPADVVPGALVTAAGAGGQTVAVDLRAVAGALAGRADLDGWQIDVRNDSRGGPPLVLARIAPTGDDAAAALGAHADIEALAGSGVTQIVVDRALGADARGLVRR